MTPIENYISELKAAPLGFLETYRYKNTKDMVLPKYMDKIQEPTVITVPYWRNLLVFSPSVIVGGCITYVTLSSNQWELPLLLTTVAAVTLIYLTIRDKKNPKVPVIANNEMLKFKTYTFLWDNIINSYILVNDGAKKKFKSLLIENQQGIIEKFPFDDDEIRDTKLASIIEYYKNKYQHR